MRRAGARVRLALVALLACAAPTAGDIGSCGQEIVELDAGKFFSEKKLVDCEACTRCAFETARCAAACGPDAAPDAFPLGCFPLVHDGEVCLNALRAAGCDEYAAYVDDAAATVPTECNFCPAEAAP